MSEKSQAKHTGRTIFLDRDGTINQEVHYLHRKEELILIPGAASAIRLFNENGFRVVVVTNQAGVARGYYTEKDINQLHEHLNQVLEQEGAHIDQFYYCPHHPDYGIGKYKTVCRCRKPDIGMFEAAEQDGFVDKAHSYMIGDKWLDTQAGVRFGVHPVLVATGYGMKLYQEYQKEKGGESSSTEDLEHPMEFFGQDLLQAAQWIIEREGISNEADGTDRTFN